VGSGRTDRLQASFAFADKFVAEGDQHVDQCGASLVMIPVSDKIRKSTIKDDWGEE